MSGLSVLCLFAGLLHPGQPAAAAAASIGSYLYEPAFALDHELRGTPQPYALQPGDICFAVNNHWGSRIGHRITGAGLPNHSMLVYDAGGGQLRIVEAGPHSQLAIATADAYSHLLSYEQEGSRVWVRRRRSPLTPAQSAAVAEFCAQQDGKDFPIIRLGAQATRIRSRGPLRTAWLGTVDYDKQGYFCSELVMNALGYGGVLDADVLRPSATYPHDIFFSSSKNYFVKREVKLLKCDWDPPARWTSSPCGPPPDSDKKSPR
jgi:hypothetical protein